MKKGVRHHKNDACALLNHDKIPRDFQYDSLQFHALHFKKYMD